MFCSYRISTDKRVARSLCHSSASCSDGNGRQSWIFKFTYLLITILPSCPLLLNVPGHRRKKIARRLYNFLCLKLRGTESHKISIRCTTMTADYCAEIKIVIFQSVLERQRDEWRSWLNCGRIAAKIASFYSVNSEIIGRKFGYDVAWLLPLNLLKADLRSASPLSNAEAKTKGRSTRRLRTSPKFNWLP